MGKQNSVPFDPVGKKLTSPALMSHLVGYLEGVQATRTLEDQNRAWFESNAQVEADLVSKGEASSALLAFHLCMSRFDLAIQVAEQLEDSEVRKLVEEWDTEAQQLLGLWLLCKCISIYMIKE